MSSAGVTVGGELCLDSIDGAISQAVLGTFDSALDGVIADCVPPRFLITHVAKLVFFVSRAVVVKVRKRIVFKDI